MTPLIIDDFASDFLTVRNAVIDGEFSTKKGPDGALYTGISMYPVPQWYERLSQAFKRKVLPTISCFRLNLGGELPHSWVHSDEICAKYASVLYMNLPSQCKGGTAFWRHKNLGIDRLPSRTWLAARGHDPNAFSLWLTEEWKHKDSWEQTHLSPMKSNRFITYPTSYFHSRWPWAAWGDRPENGRLIWICFYDLEGDTPSA